MASSDVIEVFIETLHGTAFELLVSPADTVVSIKSRISRLEGIPVSQQHLIWQCQELPDESSLHDCNITDGATLKLVLGMRGGPINTRKASLEDRPTLYDVAKYLDTKGDELGGLSTPRLRAVRMVVMRDGDKVHLYTVVDGATRPPSGLLSEDNTPRELSDEDSASESRRHRENLLTRQKVEQLQRKMHACRLRKEGHKASGGAAKEPAPAEDATTTEVKLPPLEYVLPPIQPRNTRRRETMPDGTPVPSASAPWYPFPPGNARACIQKARERSLKKEEAQRACGTGLPLLPPGSSSRSSPTTRHWRSLCQSNDGGASQLPPPQSAGAKPEATGAVPKRIEPKRVEPNVGSLHGRSTAAFQGRCRKVLLVTTSLGQAGHSASHGGASLAEDDAACSLEPGRIYKVLPPVGRQQQGCSCLHPECDRPPEQDMATAPLLEPLELDWADCERPRTAPARFVRLSVLRSTMRPTVSSPCSPNKGQDAASAAGAAKVAEASSSPLSPTSSSPVSSSPLSPSPRASSPTSPAALLLDTLPTGVDACRHDLAAARRPPPPGGAEGIRWALGDGGRRAAVPSPTRLRASPLLRRVRPELWPEHPNLSCWARAAADNEGDDRKTPPPSGAVPTSNGPSSGGSEKAAGSSTEADPAATGAAVPPEGSTTTVSSTGGGAASSTLVAETSSSLTGPTASSGSNLALSVDVGTVSATEMSSGNGMVPIQLDEDSSSTSESKTDDAISDPLHPSPGKAKKKGKRCSWCNKKTGLASTYVCRCGSIFCATHRYAEEHACSHDYKTEGRYILQRNNPVVKAAKLPKI
ncbi:uncharacterized protein LOC144116354 isoform X3 [Amblyomma americanum]|uniref:Uncharacterized protein n=2 Tax=Amblyomma americanum TaxID=6943 RepID=A0AAQ4E9I7_AMBAM